MSENSNGGRASDAAKTAGTIAISTSLALIATNAMAQAGHEQVISVNQDAMLDAELNAQIDAAINKRNVRDAVNDVFGLLVTKFERDGVNLADEYFKDTPFEYAIVAQSGESTSSGGNVPSLSGGGGHTGGGCYSNCHGACHGACHGSRGWR